MLFRDVTKYPDADLPKIDWKYYENYINPVDLNALQEIKQKYISFSVPFPKDVEGLIQSLEAQENTVKVSKTKIYSIAWYSANINFIFDIYLRTIMTIIWTFLKIFMLICFQIP